MPKTSIVDPRQRIVSLIRHASLELSNLANEVEQLESMEKVAKTLQRTPNLLDIFRKALWELQNGRLDKVSDLLDEAGDESANKLLEEASVS